MCRNEFLRELDELFELEPGSVRVDQHLKDIRGWDSLTFLGLIAMVDERYGVSLAPKQVLSCGTVEGLMSLVDGVPLQKAA